MLTYLQRIEWFIGLVLLQVLVLNHMHINGYATPFFFIYFILKYNSGVSRNVLMIWAFLIDSRYIRQHSGDECGCGHCTGFYA